MNTIPPVFKVDNNGKLIDLTKIYTSSEELGDNLDLIEAQAYPDFPNSECWDDTTNQNNLLTPDGEE